MNGLLGGLLVAVALSAVWFDVRERRIPNALTVGALGLALLLRATLGADELVAGLTGTAIGFGLALPFFLVGGLGGGDVKLLAAVGAFLGPGRIWFALLVMALVGGIMAVFVIARNRAFRDTAANLHAIFTTFGARTFTGWKGEGSGAAVTLETPGVLTVPYGVAIAAGAIGAWLAYGLDPNWSLTATLSGWLQ